MNLRHLTLLWARTGYRPWAKLLHRFNLHHTRAIGPLEDGVTLHRCEWCGVSRTEVPMWLTIQRMRAANHDAILKEWKS